MSAVIAAAAAIVVAACAGDTADAPADVQLPGAPVAIESSPTLGVGVLDGDPMEELDRVVTPFLMDNEILAIPNRGSSSIRLFGPDGAFRSSLGSEGRGPGEFTYLRSAWPRGDTIEAFDINLQRLTRFLPDGGVETLRVGDIFIDDAMGPLGSGWALTAIATAPPGMPDPMTVYALSREDSTLARVADAGGMVRHQLPEDCASGPHPLSPTAIFHVHRGELYVAESVSPRIRVFDAAGSPRREIPVPLAEPGDAAAVLREVIDSALARPDDGGIPAAQRCWNDFPEPDRLSVLWDFLVDELGFIWVRPYEPLVHALALGGRPGGLPGPGGRWLVLSPEGAEVGRLEVPQGVEPERITRDALVGIHRDELGVQSVRVHAVTRR